MKIMALEVFSTGFQGYSLRTNSFMKSFSVVHVPSNVHAIFLGQSCSSKGNSTSFNFGVPQDLVYSHTIVPEKAFCIQGSPCTFLDQSCLGRQFKIVQIWSASRFSLFPHNRARESFLHTGIRPSKFSLPNDSLVYALFSPAFLSPLHTMM